MLDATLAILNARIVTLNVKQPKADAVAIRENKIVAVGDTEDVMQYIGEKTKVIDAKGKTAIPGFTDCHVHMTGFGYSLQTLELRRVKSIKEIRQRLREYSGKNPKARWILGGRWDQDRFCEKRYPNRWDLDAAVADRPVFLLRVCGHISVVNSKALQLAGITNKTIIEGGKIDLDEKTGEPTGLLGENAVDLIWKVIPKPNLEELEKACLRACKKAVEVGITCVHWLIGSPDEARMIQKLYRDGKLPLRVYMGIPVSQLERIINLGLSTGFGNETVMLGFVKILADGSLGGHTASLKEPYSDRPETSGIMLYTQKTLDRLVSRAHKAGCQLAIHAIGDRAFEAVLEAYEKAQGTHPIKDRRHRAEHCSVLNPKLIERMKRLSLIASVQPHFIESDFWVTDRLGKRRARWVYPFKTLIKEGIKVASGSDCPVEPMNPIFGIWAAVTRKNPAEERLTVEEALITYTANAAYASFDEDKRGTIEVGKLADLTILSDDLFGISPNDIRRVNVEMTIVDGKAVYVRTHSKKTY